MQISSATTIPFIPISLGNTTSSSDSTASASDQAVLNFSAQNFSSLVDEAKSHPDVRGDVVDSFKSRIQSGHYPSSDTLDSLTSVMAGVVGASLVSGETE